jgi:hypothetical protein
MGETARLYARSMNSTTVLETWLICIRQEKRTLSSFALLKQLTNHPVIPKRSDEESWFSPDRRRTQIPRFAPDDKQLDYVVRFPSDF